MQIIVIHFIWEKLIVSISGQVRFCQALSFLYLPYIRNVCPGTWFRTYLVQKTTGTNAQQYEMCAGQ